jgi:hypothetical protein
VRLAASRPPHTIVGDGLCGFLEAKGGQHGRPESGDPPLRLSPGSSVLPPPEKPAGARFGLILPWEQVVGMYGEDIPIDADIRVVPALGLLKNLASLCVGQMRANLFNVIDMPRNLDGVGGWLRALAHG